MGWLSRLEGKGWEASAVDNFSGDAAALYKDLQATSLAFKSFVETANLEKTVFFEHKGNDYHIPQPRDCPNRLQPRYLPPWPGHHDDASVKLDGCSEDGLY
jgi:hypothetical protein